MKFRIEDCVQRGHQLRHRRRSRFHPDRRSAHPADHFRPQRGIHRQVLQDQPHHPQAGPRRSDRRQGAGREVHHRRLHRRRKASQSAALTEEGVLQGREAARHRQPVRPAATSRWNHHVQQALRPTCSIQRDRDYVGARTAEVIIVDEFTGRLMPGRRWTRRSAPGRRSQGRRQDRARESDARHHHLPELLPHVQEAGRHDRYGGNGSGRIREDLQARRHRHPDQPADDPQGESGRRLPHRGGEVPQRRQGDQGAATRRASRCWSAPSRSRSPSGSPAFSRRWASSTKC